MPDVRVNLLEALDGDGLHWTWVCGQRRFRAGYVVITDCWVVEVLDDLGDRTILEEDCISFRETVLRSLDLVKRGDL